MAFGINDTGFEIKRLEDIIEEKRALAVSLFQDLLEEGDFVDTSDSSTLGRLISLATQAEAVTWEQLQLAYSSLDPNTATGIALDNIVQYSGITRQSPSYSLVTGLFKGDNGTSIPIGSNVGSNSHGNIFSTTSTLPLTPTTSSGVDISVFSVANSTNYTITYSISSVSSNTVTYTSDASATESEILTGLYDEIISAHPLLSASIVDGILVVTKTDIFQTSTFSVSSNLQIDKVSKLGSMIAEEIGAISAPSNTLTIIKTPVLGWDSVTNPSAATEGSEQETDEELRLRFRNTKFELSSNILDSMYSALSALSGVENVAVYENDTDVTDGNGLPPHSFMAVVLGADSETVAHTIWLNKPTGITSVGNTLINVTDSQLFTHPINFERPTPIPIYITMTLTTDELFPADGEDQIKSAILEYSQSQFSVGDDVIYTRLYTPINSVEGHQVDSLFIGTSPAPTNENNIAIPFNDIASFDSVNIIINT